MKYLPIILFLFLCIGVFIINSNSNAPEYDYLRIHIRANSNDEVDQIVKYIIKDEVVDYVTPHLVGCDSKEKSVRAINGLLPNIEGVCDGVLSANGFSYTAKAQVRVEKFPTRTYDNVTLQAGNYHALIIELGSGEGDNWWCIVYPPLCFVNKSGASAQNIQYQSYLMDVVKKYFD